MPNQKSVADFVIQEVIYATVQTSRETLTTPAEYELFCQECGGGIHSDHLRGCEMEIVQQFLADNENIIEQFVRRMSNAKNSFSQKDNDPEHSRCLVRDLPQARTVWGTVRNQLL